MWTARRFGAAARSSLEPGRRVAPASSSCRPIHLSSSNSESRRCGVADLPTDEVTAPGRVIIDPHRVSRVLLPVSGRIVSVLATLGAAVEAGQPVVTVDSPDADAAVATYLQAQAARASGDRGACQGGGGPPTGDRAARARRRRDEGPAWRAERSRPGARGSRGCARRQGARVAATRAARPQARGVQAADPRPRPHQREGARGQRGARRVPHRHHGAADDHRPARPGVVCRRGAGSVDPARPRGRTREHHAHRVPRTRSSRGG